MQYLRENISQALIKRNMVTGVTDIKDPRYPLRFRYNKARNGGSWFYVRGKKWRKVGTYPLVSFAAIVDRLPLIEINFACGLDDETATVEHFETVSDLLNWHLERALGKVALSDGRKAGIKTATKRYLTPRIGSLYLADVTAYSIDSNLLVALQRDGYSIATCNLAFGVLKKAFKTAHALSLIDSNPMASMKFSDFIGESPQPKRAALEPRHIPDVLTNTNNAQPPAVMLVRLMALHGTRIGETRVARWSNIDLENRVWFIPAEDTKTKSAIKIPLSELTVRLLSDYKHWLSTRAQKSVYLFRGSVRAPFTPKQANDAVKSVSRSMWTAHDLRKAFRDLLGELGTDYITAEKLINHSLTKLDKTYNQSEMMERMRAATNAAHDHIQAQRNYF